MSDLRDRNADYEAQVMELQKDLLLVQQRERILTLDNESKHNDCEHYRRLYEHTLEAFQAECREKEGFSKRLSEFQASYWQKSEIATKAEMVIKQLKEEKGSL